MNCYRDNFCVVCHSNRSRKIKKLPGIGDIQNMTLKEARINEIEVYLKARMTMGFESKPLSKE